MFINVRKRSQMSVFNHIIISVKSVVKSFFIADMDVISIDTKKILSNPDDKARYLKAIKELREQSDKGKRNVETTITLSDDSQVTLSN